MLGDTASALAGARAAVAREVPVAHVEAGLRTGDLTDPWPEEAYRVEIDRLATYRYCPTDANRANLVAESLDGLTTGNTITDALRLMGVTRTYGKHVLVTLHRRESFGEPMENILRGLGEAAARQPDVPFCFPVHPNPQVRAQVARWRRPKNLVLGGPLPYRDFLTFLSSARAVLTDSGGVIEEAATLGVATVIARNHTERPECVGQTAQLVGTRASAVWEGLDWALTTPVEPSAVFGDGYAADRIANEMFGQAF